MTKLSKTDLSLWQNETNDVKKIKKPNKHKKESTFFYTNEHHFAEFKQKSEVAYNTAMLNNNTNLKSDFKTKHATSHQDDINSARKTVDKKIQLKLKRGEIAYQDVLDLHGMFLDQARSELIYFINTSFQRGLKCILVVHGKGYNAESNMGQIKQQIPFWLENMDCVLSFTSAIPKHGGTGAMYILLRRAK